MLRRTFATLTIMIAAASLAACGKTAQLGSDVSQGSNSKTSAKSVASMTPEERAAAESELLASIRDVAQTADNNFEETWICNRNPRVLKTGYARVPAQGKAEFALAYRQMLEAQNENLAMDINTYVSYEKRAAFARDYWRNSKYADAFAKETDKKKVQWIYESMLDAGELFWRGYESLHPEQMNSAAVLAHYKEQDMVFNYMENEHKPSSFSEQYSKWMQSEGEIQVKAETKAAAEIQRAAETEGNAQIQGKAETEK